MKGRIKPLGVTPKAPGGMPKHERYAGIPAGGMKNQKGSRTPNPSNPHDYEGLDGIAPGRKFGEKEQFPGASIGGKGKPTPKIKNVGRA